MLWKVENQLLLAADNGNIRDVDSEMDCSLILIYSSTPALGNQRVQQ